MAVIHQKIVPCIWMEKDAEKAAAFYVSVFKKSRILNTAYYPEAAEKVSGWKRGSVMTVKLSLEGQEFLLLNGGPAFKVSEAISFMVSCETQKEIDYLWKALSAVPEAEICGWLKDKYGLSWQIVPAVLESMTTDRDPEKVERVTAALLKMKKLDIRALQKAFSGRG